MLKQLGISTLLLSLTTLSYAANETPNNVPLNDESAKVSYGLGINIGTGLRAQGLQNINVDALSAGISDSINEKPLRISEDELNKAFASMQEQYKAEQQVQAQQNLQSSKNFLDQNKKMEGVKTTATGLQYKVIKAGDGPLPKKDDTVVVQYRGKLADGTEFDSSYERNEPAEFRVDQVIPGWTEALQLMPVGSKWELFIPADLAYGENSPSPVIPPNSMLIFDVELLEIKKGKS